MADSWFGCRAKDLARSRRLSAIALQWPLNGQFKPGSGLRPIHGSIDGIRGGAAFVAPA
jgi:hypothetical protein